MCTHERGMSIYMAENPDEFKNLKSKIDAVREECEALAYGWGWKIAAHMTIRELIYPEGAQSWEPLHLVELATYITSDRETVESLPTAFRHEIHQRMLKRLGSNKALRVDVAETLAAEIHVKAAIYENEWAILEAAHALARTLDNVDECLKLFPAWNHTKDAPLHPFDAEGPLPKISSHKPLH